MNRSTGFFCAVAAAMSAVVIQHSCETEPDITTGRTYVQDAVALDGDTFRLDGRHYRMSSIDAPELPGHCRRGRHCAPGNPYRSRHELQAKLSAGVFCRANGLDVYGRTLVTCWSRDGLNINDSMVEQGYAIPYRRS